MRKRKVWKGKQVGAGGGDSALAMWIFCKEKEKPGSNDF